MRLRKYTELDLRNAVSGSVSLRGVLDKLKINPAGGNYTTLKKAILHFGVDTGHFTGSGHLKGKTHTYNTRTLDEILVYGRHENTFSLKRRLLKEGLKERKCECCEGVEWNEAPMPLELHHEDGDRQNNKLENLTLLCPNCHAQTGNYRGKNKRCRDLTGTA